MMVINEPQLAQFAQKIVNKFWGVEFWMVNTPDYCLKFLKVKPGYQSSIHAHAIKDETFVGVMGTVQLNIHTVKADLSEVHAITPGKQFHLPPEMFHSFQAINQSWIMEVSTHHSDTDVIRLQESRRLEP